MSSGPRRPKKPAGGGKLGKPATPRNSPRPPKKSAASDCAPAAPRQADRVQSAAKSTGLGTSVLDVRHLSKTFRSRQVIKDISFEVRSGEVVGLLGPNGAGKTTSFYMIAGLIPSDGGSIRLDGQEIGALPIDRRARLGIAYLPQEASIFRAMTVEENIMAILEVQPGFERAAARSRLESLLHAFQVQHLRGQRGASLSGGERRRVEIARSLAANPRFLLLDEPFAGVDPISVHGLQAMIRSLADEDIGILITDHNVRETLSACDRSCIVHDGRIIKEGAAQAILADQRVQELYLGRQFGL